MTSESNWYALKVFYNKSLALKERLEDAGFGCYCALGYEGRPLVASLLFVRCSERQLLEYKATCQNDISFAIYTRKEMRSSHFDSKPMERNVPAPIPENEMRAFILVTSASPDTYEVLGPDDPKYHVGQKVRVAEGIFTGAEGYVKRIKKDRRLVISVSGIVAVATVHIRPEYLKPVEEN
ncbi:MAG: UpxY family transcription antiterminator [Bacteroidales bacterium]|nr:UpxY family transcription antiterminator [Bacteroidales bacterium]